MKTPLSEITVTCSQCQATATAQQINDDATRFHDTNGSIVRFPAAGITPAQEQQLSTLQLTCELCHDEN